MSRDRIADIFPLARGKRKKNVKYLCQRVKIADHAAQKEREKEGDLKRKGRGFRRLRRFRHQKGERSWGETSGEVILRVLGEEEHYTLTGEATTKKTGAITGGKEKTGGRRDYLRALEETAEKIRVGGCDG